MDRTARILGSLIVVMVSIMLLLWVGPAVETRFFPVYSRFQVVSAEPVEGGTVATFRFTKYRDCEARGWAWYIGEFGALARQVEINRVNGTSARRKPGLTVSSPYFIAATPDQVRNDMQAEILSYCHPFWPSRSVVRP